MTDTIWCGRCRKRLSPDVRHYWVDMEGRPPQGPMDGDEYVLCPECKEELTEDWMDPA